jgi:hypothetical protein
MPTGAELNCNISRYRTGKKANIAIPNKQQSYSSHSAKFVATSVSSQLQVKMNWKVVGKGVTAHG